MIIPNIIRSIRIQGKSHQVLISFRGIKSNLSQSIDDRDTFGTLSQRGSKSLELRSLEKSLPDDADGYDKEEIDLTPRKNEYYYKYEIGKLAREGKTGLRIALELFHEMKSHSRLTPNLNVLSPLIYGCARAGYTKRAFELYDETCKYVREKPTNSMITCLFNACANSPFPEYGIARLDWFMNHLRMNLNVTLNRLQYNSAIKAYGQLGRLDKASSLVKDMIDQGFMPDTELFNNLLVGCSKDREAGCILALRVYKRLRVYGLKPDIYTFGLMLKCIRSCKLGSDDLIRQTLDELPELTTVDQRLLYKSLKSRGKKVGKQKSVDFEWLPLVTQIGANISAAIVPPPPKESKDLALKPDHKHQLISNELERELDSTDLMRMSSGTETEMPNLLSDDHAHLLSRIQAIKSDLLEHRQGRLSLFGGPRGFLETLKKFGCEPNAQLFSMLLPCIDKSVAAQNEFFQLSCDYNIKRDLVFYDSFIKFICDNYHDVRRIERALAYIDEMHKDNLRPNISTFEHIALGCNNMSQAQRLIRDMERSGLVVTDTLVENLFTPAIKRRNFEFLNGLLKLTRRKNHCLTKEIIEKLEATRLECYDLIQRYERNKLPDDQRPSWLNDGAIECFTEFNEHYPKWLKSVKLMVEEHPWKQFHVESDSKRRGFVKFVKTFQALDKAKHAAIREGKPLGNLMEKVMHDEDGFDCKTNSSHY